MKNRRIRKTKRRKNDKGKKTWKKDYMLKKKQLDVEKRRQRKKQKEEYEKKIKSWFN